MAEEGSPPKHTSRELEIVPSQEDARLSNIQRPIHNAAPVVRFFGFVFLFNALLWVFALFVQIRGWVDVTASYVLLGIMWIIGFLICLGLALQSTMTWKKTAITVASLLWFGALVGLNAVAPKPHVSQEAKIIPAPGNDGHQPRSVSPAPVVSIPEPPRRLRPKPMKGIPPDGESVLSVSLVNPSTPQLTIANPSSIVADGVIWRLTMFRTTDLRIFSYGEQHVGYLKPGAQIIPTLIQPNLLPHTPGTDSVKDGDSFIGTLTVDCPLCKGNTLIVRFIWGQSGWFHEFPSGKGQTLLPKDARAESIKEYIDLLENFAKPNERSVLR